MLNLFEFLLSGCWHKWGPWDAPRAGYHTGKGLLYVKHRECIKCGKIETKWLTSDKARSL